MAVHSCNKEGEIGYIREKVDKIDDKVDEIRITLVRQQEILNEHIRRTHANEQQLAILKTQVEPVTFARKWLIISGKVVGILAAVVGALAGAYRFLVWGGWL